MTLVNGKARVGWGHRLHPAPRHMVARASIWSAVDKSRGAGMLRQLHVVIATNIFFSYLIRNSPLQRLLIPLTSSHTFVSA